MILLTHDNGCLCQPAFLKAKRYNSCMTQLGAYAMPLASQLVFFNMSLFSIQVPLGSALAEKMHRSGTQTLQRMHPGRILPTLKKL
jgi:hypothetical protein